MQVSVSDANGTDLRAASSLPFVRSRACPELDEGNHERNSPQPSRSVRSSFDRLRACPGPRSGDERLEEVGPQLRIGPKSVPFVSDADHVPERNQFDYQARKRQGEREPRFAPTDQRQSDHE
jgi:hypothetical protein